MFFWISFTRISEFIYFVISRLFWIEPIIFIWTSWCCSCNATEFICVLDKYILLVALRERTSSFASMRRATWSPLPAACFIDVFTRCSSLWMRFICWSILRCYDRSKRVHCRTFCYGVGLEKNDDIILLLILLLYKLIFFILFSYDIDLRSLTYNYYTLTIKNFNFFL